MHRRFTSVFARRLAATAVAAAPLLVGAAGVVAVIGAGGCFGRESPSLKSNDPSRKIPAIKQAVEQHDSSAIPQLIKALSSEDPAIRFYAIQGLERLTGQTLDYRFYDSDHERAQAVRRWKRWYEDRANGASSATSTTSTTSPSTAPTSTSEAARE